MSDVNQMIQECVEQTNAQTERAFKEQVTRIVNEIFMVQDQIKEAAAHLVKLKEKLQTLKAPELRKWEF